MSLLAALAWVATRLGRAIPDIAHLRWVFATIGLGLLFARTTRWAVVVMFVAVTGVAAAGGAAAWQSVAPIGEHECSGAALVRSDPQRRGSSTSVILDINGRRWRALAHGRLAWRLSRVAAGENLQVEATCAAGVGRFADVDRVRHVVGVATLASVSEISHPGSRIALASNRVRRALADGSASLTGESGPRFLGLIIGDDRSQSQEMIGNFRAAGLSHLTAVSGQNIAYLLALTAPLLQVLSRWWRLAMVAGLMSWFVLLTRAEPSVVRAAAMALVSACAAVGVVPSHRFSNGRTVLALAVLAVLALDPMLAWSVGFALSVAATAGLAWLSGPLLSWFGRGRFAHVVVPALAAQIATAPVSLAVFGSVPVVGLVANPLAVPVAGIVMTIGIPLALVASFFEPIAPLVGAILSPLVSWIAAVARWAAALGPRGWVNAASWSVVVLVMVSRAHHHRRPVSGMRTG